jgi:hypothetical protein
MTWAEAERPGIALVIASGFLSNPAKDWLAAYERNRHPPFRIRHWEKPVLERMLAKHPSLMAKHGIIAEEVRTLAEIIAAEHEYFDKVWYVRKLIREEKVASGEVEPLSPALAAQVEAAMRAIEKRYGAENVGPWDDWTWGTSTASLLPYAGYLAASGTFSTHRPERRDGPSKRRGRRAIRVPYRRVNHGIERTITVTAIGSLNRLCRVLQHERIPRICLIRMRSQVQGGTTRTGYRLTSQSRGVTATWSAMRAQRLVRTAAPHRSPSPADHP